MTFGDQLADDFVLPAGHTTIVSVHWFGTYDPAGSAPAGPGHFRLRIFNNAGGIPANTPIFDAELSEVERFDTGETIGG